MATIFENFSIGKFVRNSIATLSAVMLVACGGGGGSPGTTTGSSGVSKAGIALELVDANNVGNIVLTTSTPLTARATVFDASGKPAPNVIVTFTVGQSSVLSPSAGTGLTNANGVATIKLSVKDLATAQTQAGAAETLTAAVTIGTQALIAKLNYKIAAPAISLKLNTPPSGAVNISAYQTTPIQVSVYADGSLYTAQPVTLNFSSACTLSGKASMAATATTSNGLAQVVYTDKGCSSIDNVTISAAGAPSLTVNIVVAPPVAASISFVSAIPSDKAIVIKGAGGTGRTETAILTYLVQDTFGQPLPNQVVNFSVNSTQPVFLQSTSAISGPDGKVVVSVNSGDQPTTFRIIATLASGQSTISDTITVTTGQPTQASVSVSVETFNIEGWNFDNIKTKINVLLADMFGNPVADGTPVVFQTDSGAIGSSSIGGCITANGACSVDFRSQNPRYGVGNTEVPAKRAGLATINVSSTTALITLSGQTSVFLSGSSAANVYYNDTRLVPFSRTSLVTGSCGTFSLPLELNDVNFNPLPMGTKVEATNTDKITVQEIIPDVVPNIGAHAIAGSGTFLVAGPSSRQGSLHIIPIKTGDNCVTGGTSYTETGSVDVKITTPLGSPVVYGFNLNYPVAAPPVTCTAPQVAQNGVCVTPVAPTLSVAIFNAAGTSPANSVAVGGNLTIRATVRDGAGAPVANKLVTFTITPAIATMNPPSATALTNSSGVASIIITGTVVGAATIKGAASVATTTAPAGVAVSGSADFAVTP